jgi:putative transposase
LTSENDVFGKDNLGEHAHQVKFMIRDRGSNFTTAFDAVLADAGIRIVLCNVQTPRMNAIAERWIGDAGASFSTAP